VLDYLLDANQRADIDVNDDGAMWRIAGSAWLYVVKDVERAGHSLATLCVADLDAAVVELAKRGMTGGPIEESGAPDVRRPSPMPTATSSVSSR
jgi:hypothetical protein